MRSLSIQGRDLQHIWHPCSQMKDYTDCELLAVVAASGSYLTLENGNTIIDAISSWWCKSLGHAHPQLQRALIGQMERFEHVMLAGTTNETIVQLSEELASLMPALNKVFYAGDGSCAVEIAMKMSLHWRKLQSSDKRTKFIALENGYHGETLATLSVSDVGIYRDPYKDLLFPCHFIKSLPYVTGEDDPLWHDCSDYWDAIERQLQPYGETATAILFEPVVQGAGGMLIYSQDFLRRLAKWAREHHVHLIADEIMTGLYRTGAMLACEHAGIEPDFICLSKGLTSGFLPLSAVLTRQCIYDSFYDDYETGKAFLHSHTYSGNALAASVALEVLTIMKKENMLTNVKWLSKQLQQNMQSIVSETDCLTEMRGVGGVVAANLKPHPEIKRIGFEVYKEAIQLGALLRPLGNTIYWLPPLNIKACEVEALKLITQKAIAKVYRLKFS